MSDLTSDGASPDELAKLMKAAFETHWPLSKTEPHLIKLTFQHSLDGEGYELRASVEFHGVVYIKADGDRTVERYQWEAGQLAREMAEKFRMWASEGLL